MTQLEADFCVVGTGISGLAAAYWLHKADSTVVVLEAADRIGGRIWTERLSNGTPFEIGAQWVSDREFQPHIRALMDELARDRRKNIDMYEQYIGNSGELGDPRNRFFHNRANFCSESPINDVCDVGIHLRSLAKFAKPIFSQLPRVSIVQYQ